MQIRQTRRTPPAGVDFWQGGTEGRTAAFGARAHTPRANLFPLLEPLLREPAVA
jgi:hypothetical protein